MLCGTVSSAPVASTPPGVKLFAAGNDQILWLVVGQWNAEKKTYVNGFAAMDASSSQARVVIRIGPQDGTIEHIAAVGRQLDVFYGPDAHFSEDGAHDRFDRSGGGRAMPLPGNVMPMAIAGESAGDLPRLWAVVPAVTADAVRAAWNARQSQATQPEDESAATVGPATSPAASKPAKTTAPAALTEPYHLVQYDGMNWQGGVPAPAECGSSERMWLALAADRFHLFWQADAKSAEIHYARHEKGAWVIGPGLPLDEPPVDALATVINTKLIFAALHRVAPGSPKLRVSLWTWQPGGAQAGVEPGGTWSRLTNLEDSTKHDLILPGNAALSAFVDKLAVLRATTDGPAEFAIFSPMTGGQPDRGFQPIPQPGGNSISKTQQNLRSLVATLLVAALTLLVCWRRQDSVATPVLLPAGLAIAGPGKRAAAALVDMMPAALIAGSIWYQPLREFMLESQAAMAAGQSDSIDTPATVMHAWLCYAIIYAVWCTLFEIFWQTTPGKRLVGCEVRQESSGPPNAVQIIIRNITKILELLPYLQIWPFMLVVFFTRNHQRLGDLLARTVVVERQYLVTGNDDDLHDPSDRG